MLNKMSQSQKDMQCMIQLHEAPRGVKFTGTENRTVVAKSSGGEGMRGHCLVHTEFQFCKVK